MRWVLGGLHSVLALLTLAGVSEAQRAPTPILSVGTELRILLRDATRAQGTLAHTTAQAIVLRRVVGAGSAVRTVDRTVPLDSIVAASHQAGTRWRSGAIVGAAVGLLGMVLLLDQLPENSDPGTCSPGCWVGGIGFGIAAGGLIGAFVGHYIGKWEPVPGWSNPPDGQ